MAVKVLTTQLNRIASRRSQKAHYWLALKFSYLHPSRRKCVIHEVALVGMCNEHNEMHSVGSE